MQQMKNSGIEWIGEIPESWDIIKTKNIFRYFKRIVGNRHVETERLALTLNGVIKRDKNEADGLQPEKFDTYQFLYKNELVFKLIDLGNIATSRVGLSPFDGMVSPAYIILRSECSDNRFYYYFYLSMWHRNIFNSLGDNGVRSSIGANDLLNLPIVNTTEAARIRIADFLDKKCVDIDNLIAHEVAAIEELKAYKQSVITETVIKGLDKSVPMKDSGVEWIGQIPASWSIVKTKNIFRNVKRIVGDQHAETERLALTLNGVIKRDKNEATGLQPENFETYQFLYRNELVFKLIDLGNVATSRVGLSPFDGMVSPAYIILQNKFTDNRFYLYFFLSMWYRQIFNALGDNGVRSSLNAQDLLNIPTVLLPEPERKKISDYLDKKCAEIDDFISIKQQKIEELKEYKKSLIYEYVTGKKEVV